MSRLKISYSSGYNSAGLRNRTVCLMTLHLHRRPLTNNNPQINSQNEIKKKKTKTESLTQSKFSNEKGHVESWGFRIGLPGLRSRWEGERGSGIQWERRICFYRGTTNKHRSQVSTLKLCPVFHLVSRNSLLLSPSLFSFPIERGNPFPLLAAGGGEDWRRRRWRVATDLPLFVVYSFSDLGLFF